MSFAAKVEALQAFFGTPPDGTQHPLADRLASMHTAMGMKIEGTLPEQVEALLEVTGVSVASGSGDADSSDAAAKTSKRADDLGTSLGGIGSGPDKRQLAALAKHKARDSKPLVDERAVEIAKLRKLFEGRANGPDKYKHADYLGPDAEGTLPTQIAGGLSYSLSMVQEWESPAFFKDTATKMATKPVMRRCNPVAGKYPEFR